MSQNAMVLQQLEGERPGEGIPHAVKIPHWVLDDEID
jgi:hypothetical protein